MTEPEENTAELTEAAIEAEENKPTSRNRKFVHDLGIYAIGNLGSKLITFLLVPFYTFYITNPADFGYYDVCLTIVFCFGPFVTLQLSEGGFRFLLESKDSERRTAIVSYVVTTMLRNAGIVIATGIGVAFFAEVKYLWFVIAFGLLQTGYDASLQLVRGLGQTKIFMYAGIINSATIAMLSVLFVAVIPMGIPGVFIANICARLLTILFIESRVHIIGRYFHPSLRNKQMNRELLRYSLPLLPAILIWWVLNSNNVFFIQHYLGLDENGIYAVIAKFTGMLYIISLIFYQTWQQNAIEQYHAPDRDDFFSEVFNNYLYLLCGLLIIVPFGLRINYSWLVGPEYQESSKYLFLNSIYVVFYALAAFYELGYQCAKKTHRILPSFILITIVGLGSNFLLIEHMRLYGVIASNILTYLTLLIYRVIDTQKYMKVRFFGHNYMTIGLTIAAGICYELSESAIYDIVLLSLLIASYILIMPKSLKNRVPILNRIRI